MWCEGMCHVPRMPKRSAKFSGIRARRGPVRHSVEQSDDLRRTTRQDEKLKSGWRIAPASHEGADHVEGIVDGRGGIERFSDDIRSRGSAAADFESKHFRRAKLQQRQRLDAECLWRLQHDVAKRWVQQQHPECFRRKQFQQRRLHDPDRGWRLQLCRSTQRRHHHVQAEHLRRIQLQLRWLFQAEHFRGI